MKNELTQLKFIHNGTINHVEQHTNNLSPLTLLLQKFDGDTRKPLAAGEESGLG